MRVVAVNLAADPALRDPQQLLDAYHTLTGWSDAVVASGASVHVVQRFSRDAVVTRGAVQYSFVHDGKPGTPAPWHVFPRIAQVVADATRDVVHINGLLFPGMINALRRVAPRAGIVLQDHSGTLPRSAWPMSAWRWRRAFRHANACTFTARALAEPWRPAGLPPDMPLFEIPEASTSLTPIDREQARVMSGVRGSPAVLWVGRLDRNKDPFTVLAGLERVLPSVAHAHVTMIVPATEWRESVRKRIAASSTLRDRVTLIGPIAHTAMAAYYSAADIFVSGSHHEGSGYALIESMACGVVPCVTDIPAFRALVGQRGILWRAGDANAFAEAFFALLERNPNDERIAVRRHFQESLSWEVVGRQTVAAYSDLVRTMRAAE